MDNNGESSLLGPAQIRDLAEQWGIQPTKKLGQNFLHDAGTVRRIVVAAKVQAGDIVLEVGPGLGSLTLGLLDAGAEVCAVEIDPTLAKALPITVEALQPASLPRLQVRNADALTVSKWNNGEAQGLEPTKLVANLPYNVAVPVLLHCLTAFPTLRSALVMVQAEVADRLVAQPGNRIYGVPSVKAAWYGQAKRAGKIGRTVFWPAPNVDSALVDLQVASQPRGPEPLRRVTFRIVDAAFSSRRKMLRSALRGWVDDSEEVALLLRRARVAGTRRGETLSLDEYVRLAATALTMSPWEAPLLHAACAQIKEEYRGA